MVLVDLDRLDDGMYDLYMSLALEDTQDTFHLIVQESDESQLEAHVKGILYMFATSIARRYGEGIQGYQVFFDHALEYDRIITHDKEELILP